MMGPGRNQHDISSMETFRGGELQFVQAEPRRGCGAGRNTFEQTFTAKNDTFRVIRLSTEKRAE
jgi:hypothetical protein